MSIDSYALRRLKKFIMANIRRYDNWKPYTAMHLELKEDSLFALKIRKDESRKILQEIERMLNFKPSGRPKKMTKEGDK